MNKLIVTGFAISGITITALTYNVLKKNKRIKMLNHVSHTLLSANDLAVQMLIEQYEASGQTFVASEELTTNIQALKIFVLNQMS